MKKITDKNHVTASIDAQIFKQNKKDKNNLLKKNLKYIIYFAIIAILSSSLSVFAYSYLAKDVGYTKADGSKVTVEEALNSLYNMKGGGTSSVINNFSPTADEGGTSLTVTCNATTNNNSQVKGYIYMLNGQVAGVSTDNKYTYFNLNESTEYKISAAAIDSTGNIKVSDTIKAKTLDALYLYKDGNKYENITGGWQLTKDYNSGSDITSYNYMLIYSPEVNNRGSAISTKNAVNLTGYSKLKMLVNQKSTGTYNYFRIGAKSTPITDVTYHAFSSSDTSKEFRNNADNIVIELDISNLNGNYYIGTDCASTRVEIHSIWLE